MPKNLNDIGNLKLPSNKKDKKDDQSPKRPDYFDKDEPVRGVDNLV